MIYTPMTRKAMVIAYNAHHGQVEWDGVPYIFHPVHLAEQMNDEIATTVAILHDVVEDTSITLDDLRKEGFPECVIEAVSLLTHDDNIPYIDYVRKLKDHPIARAVKLVDLQHNCDITRRVNRVDEEALVYLERYRKAFAVLQSNEADRPLRNEGLFA